LGSNTHLSPLPALSPAHEWWGFKEKALARQRQKIFSGGSRIALELDRPMPYTVHKYISQIFTQKPQRQQHSALEIRD
jgi:hypothetical protein